MVQIIDLAPTRRRTALDDVAQGIAGVANVIGDNKREKRKETRRQKALKEQREHESTEKGRAMVREDMQTEARNTEFDRRADKAEERLRTRPKTDSGSELNELKLKKAREEAAERKKPFSDTRAAEELRFKTGLKTKHAPTLAKAEKESMSRLGSITSVGDELVKQIEDKGTFETFGAHNQTLAQKVDSMAIDAAKLFDPSSVARPSEVEAFKGMLFEPGTLTMRNETAIDTVNAFKKLVKDRARREAATSTDPAFKKRMQAIIAGGTFSIDDKTNSIRLNKDIKELTDEELDELENAELSLRNTANAGN
jgi:hypothetical protein